MSDFDFNAIFERYYPVATKITSYLHGHDILRLANVSKATDDFMMRRRLLHRALDKYKHCCLSYFHWKLKRLMHWSADIEYHDDELHDIIRNYYSSNELGVREEIKRAWAAGEKRIKEIHHGHIKESIMHPSRNLIAVRDSYQDIRVYTINTYHEFNTQSARKLEIYNDMNEMGCIYGANPFHRGNKIDRHDVKIFGVDMSDDYVAFASETHIYIHSMTDEDVVANYNSQEETDEHLKEYPISNKLKMIHQGSAYWIFACSEQQSHFSIFKFDEDPQPSIERHKTTYFDGKMKTWDFQWPYLVIGTTDGEILVHMVTLEQPLLLSTRERVKFRHLVLLGSVYCLKANPKYILSTHHTNDFLITGLEEKRIVQSLDGCLSEDPHERFKVQDISQTQSMLVVGYKGMGIEIFDISSIDHSHPWLTLIRAIQLEYIITKFHIFHCHEVRVNLSSISFSPAAHEVFVGTTRGVQKVSVTDVPGKFCKDEYGLPSRIWVVDRKRKKQVAQCCMHRQNARCCFHLNESNDTPLFCHFRPWRHWH